MDPKRLQELARKYLSGIATSEEKHLLHSYYSEVNNDLSETVITEQPITEAAFGEKMMAELQQRIASEHTAPVPLSRKKSIAYYWKAAAAIVIISVGAYLYMSTSIQKLPVAKVNIPVDVKAPSTNQATITLADGRIIYLDSSGTGSIANQGTAKLVRLDDGELVYQSNNSINSKLVYNTLSNPYGSKIAVMKLGDGTKVWLNAGSSLTYPVAFTGAERNVSIDGEAYFEVAHDPGKPFIVKKGETAIKVLGTHFNVNAYNDENEITVSLLQGKVNVVNGDELVMLLPMQEVAIEGNGIIKINKQFDPEKVMAWKNGFFSFRGASIENIMREISRWYNLRIEYQGSVTEKFNMEMERNANVSNVFEALEKTGGVHFIIDQHKIIVMP